VRQALSNVSYWLVTGTAVAVVGAVSLRLSHTSDHPAQRLAEFATIEVAAPPEPAAAEAPDPMLAALRANLPEAVAGAKAGTSFAEDAAAMAAFYETRNGPLLWVSEGGLTAGGHRVAAELGQADDWGLRASDFTLRERPTGTLSPDAAAAIEIEMTLAVLKYARFARGGRFGDPSRISKLFDAKPQVRAPKLVLSEISGADTPDTYLRSLHPKHPEFEGLRRLLVKLRGRSGTGDGIAFGANLRAVLPEPAADEAARDGAASTSGAQGSDAETAVAIDRVLVNMERWRWLPADLGAVHVWNNVPEFLTRVVKDGKAIHTDRIVVGQPDWPTPSFSADMKTVVFHPSWGVPDGIKRKELLPLLRKSSGGGLVGLFTGTQSSETILARHKLQAYHRGRPIDANQVDWSSVNVGAYEFRQPPGPANVLGTVKFMFPNTHDVYMHDTPDRALFARSFRGLSHGCMRVANPRRLAEVLLAEDKGWSERQVGDMFGGGTREVALASHIPVHVTYFTAKADEKGNLVTFGDLYGLDGRLGEALLGRKTRFRAPTYNDEIAAMRQQQRRDTAQQAGAQQAGPNFTALADAISDIFSP